MHARAYTNTWRVYTCICGVYEYVCVQASMHADTDHEFGKVILNIHKAEEDWAKGELCRKVILQRSSLLCMWQYYIVIIVWLARPS